MPEIHATAIVDPQAQLAEDAHIGPGCIIDGPAVVGGGCRLIGHVHLHGRVVLGENNTLFPFVCVGFEPQDFKFDGRTAGVVIGRGNRLREYVSVHSSTDPDQPTTLGDENYLMTSAHVAHDCQVGNRCIMATGAMLGGHVRVADQVNLGGGSGVHQHRRVGRLSILGGTLATTADITPFSMIGARSTWSGLNLIGLRRSGVSRDGIDALRQAFNLLFRTGHTRPTAIAEMEKLAADSKPQAATLIREVIEFLQTAEHPVVSAAAGRRRRA